MTGRLTVILAEKPNQAANYAAAFDTKERKDGYYIVSNDNYLNAIITYGYGHLISLLSPDEYDEKYKKWNLTTLPIFPKPFKFKVSQGKGKQYNIVKKHLNAADEIIIATDPDREGEAIARYIINHTGNTDKPTKRLWVNSNEVEEIQKAFKQLKDGKETYGFYKEAETRAYADWLVGMNLSRLYSIYMQKIGIRDSFSIGRVQTPTLYLIYQRNKEIENFVVKSFYELYANFSHEKGSYQGKYTERFNSIEELEAFTKQYDIKDAGTVSEVITEEKRTYAPKLFSLSDLQTSMNKKYKYKVAKVLDIVQNLYEKKFVSYPRTASNLIGTPEFEYLKENLNHYLNLVGETIETPIMTENKRYVDSAKVLEHYAIIPTKTIPELSKLSIEEQNIYKSILYRTLSIFEKPYVYDETTILTDVNNIEFKTTGQIEKDLGWKRLIKNQNETKNSPLPNLVKGNTVDSVLETKEGKTTPPKYFTEGSLITAMKTVGKKLDDEDRIILNEIEGIGTQATRASVIEALGNQKYISYKGNNIILTEKGDILCNSLKENEITNAELTAQWEKHLRRVREGALTQEAFIGSIQRFISHLIIEAPSIFSSKEIKSQVDKLEKEKAIATCTLCSENIINKGKFLGCSGYPNCKFTLSKEFRKKKLTKKNISELLDLQKTIVTGIKSSSGSKYNAKVQLNDSGFIEFKEFVQTRK